MAPVNSPTPRIVAGEEFENMFRKSLLVAGLIAASIALSGCVIEAPGYHRHYWGWWHHD